MFCSTNILSCYIMLYMQCCLETFSSGDNQHGMHACGWPLGVCLQFWLGPGKNDQRFLLGVYFIVLFLALQFIYAQGFNHLLSPLLFSHLK